ncbi:MAG TPA: HIT domain-containing protein [Anaerolineales bacterium]|nr:HIT domain-containing protein [Anaerolineales bacterium]
MKHLWSPWRMAYIEERDSEPGCLFCQVLAEADGPGNLILHRGRRAFVILNRFPYTNGHMMVVPFAHQPSLDTLEEQARAEVMELATRALAVLRQAYGAEAFNLGINIGAAAGAGIADHVHLHVVPRWAGDTNFMATVAEARVIPEDLAITYQRLSDAWRAA